MSSKLRAVVCGLEHSGTTLVSDLLRQSPVLQSGFECGVLMGERPSDFRANEPFFSNMLEGWKINAAELDDCCAASDFAEFYAKLAEKSPLVDSDTDIFDKTPRYICHVKEVLERVEAPIICIYKDPRSTVLSDFARSGVADFGAWYEQYCPAKKSYMRRCYAGYREGLLHPDRFVAISLEGLCFDALNTCKRIFEHVQEKFELEYFLLKNLRYSNTRESYVSAQIVLSWIGRLTKEQQKRIERDFAEFGQWFI